MSDAAASAPLARPKRSCCGGVAVASLDSPSKNRDQIQARDGSGELTKGKNDIIFDVMKVVFDTNVIVAGLYSKKGASYQLIKAALEGELPFAVSPLMALEYEGVLHQKIVEGFLQISEESCGKILNALFATATIVWKPLQIRPVLSDSADDKILECAVSCDCTHIITFNKRHFPAALTAPWGIEILTAGEFLLFWRYEQ
jgi:putative PIN family toxin of toxin-antitoxin system